MKPWICNSPYQNLTARLSELDAASEQVALSKLDNKKMQDLFILWALDLEDMCLVFEYRPIFQKTLASSKNLLRFEQACQKFELTMKPPAEFPTLL